MLGYCVLLLLVVTLLLPDTDGLWRRRRRRRRRRRTTVVVIGRDVGAASVDANKDGTIDQSEAATVMGEERAARDLLSLADADGVSRVTVDEFDRSVRDLIMMDSDKLQKLMTE